MNIFKTCAALAAVTLSSAALADTHFECGTVACSAFGTAVITAIDDVVVGGEHFNVTFTDKQQDSTFAFSYSTAAAGKPLTGIDAANALQKFYTTQQGPQPIDDGPGIEAFVDGTPTLVLTLDTAVASVQAGRYFDAVLPFLGGPYIPVTTAVNGDPQPGSSSVVDFAGKCFGTCTIWTPIAAPEISAASAWAALTLLAGLVAVAVGKRPRLLH